MSPNRGDTAKSKKSVSQNTAEAAEPQFIDVEFCDGAENGFAESAPSSQQFQSSVPMK